MLFIQFYTFNKMLPVFLPVFFVIFCWGFLPTVCRMLRLKSPVILMSVSDPDLYGCHCQISVYMLYVFIRKMKVNAKEKNRYDLKWIIKNKSVHQVGKTDYNFWLPSKHDSIGNQVNAYLQLWHFLTTPSFVHRNLIFTNILNLCSLNSSFQSTLNFDWWSFFH